ncbi:MAG: molybdopterin molybdotransferase MoeA [Acidimicrobiia bacterium]|nr:molybdopterin molybdotransferase MoeA [Acidimicrobiia bacterium]NNL70363.1 molybdopterin molybdotransferase MoeA [Acidimicrobiia bacterium]
MRPLEEAQRQVLETVRVLPVVETALADCLGLVLAEDVRATHPIPPFDNSAMDGYAVRAADVEAVPVTLTVVEDVAAGRAPDRSVGSGEAIKIMTGAPMPPGADTVIRVEDTEQAGDRVTISVGAPAGTSVRRAGGDIAADAMVAQAGTRLGPNHLGVLASVGAARPRVYRRPTVAVLSTGDEVVPYETAELAPGQIRGTNGLVLVSVLRELGVEVLDLGIVGDNADELRAALARGSREADAIVTSGGVSMGEYDLVKAVLGELGGVEFWQVAMQPGKPFAFGIIDGTPLFGLPGNPVSVFVAFEQFVRPALLHMMGSPRLFRPHLPAVLDEAVSTNPAKTVFVRVVVTWEDGRARASTSGGQDSNVLSALAAADALAVIPVGIGDVPAGGAVSLEMFRYPEDRGLSGP